MMIDFQVGDIVETNADAVGEPRITTVVGDEPPAGKSRWFTQGERATVLTVQYEHNEPFLVYVRFENGAEDNMLASWIDFVYRPINDPSLYDRSLLDLIAVTKTNQETIDHDNAMIYADTVEKKYNHLSGYGE